VYNKLNNTRGQGGCKEMGTLREPSWTAEGCKCEKVKRLDGCEKGGSASISLGKGINQRFRAEDQFTLSFEGIERIKRSFSRGKQGLETVVRMIRRGGKGGGRLNPASWVSAFTTGGKPAARIYARSFFVVLKL